MLKPFEPGEFEGQIDLFSIVGTLEPELRYSNDSVLLSNSKDGLRSSLNLLYVVSKKYNLQINEGLQETSTNPLDSARNK